MTGIISQNLGRPSGLIKATAGAGAWTLIKSLTASGSGTLSFVHGSSDVVLDSTFPIYVFKFINIHPASDRESFMMNMSIDSGSNYNVTKTTSCFLNYHAETEFTPPPLEYRADLDLAQSTAFQNLGSGLGNGNDESLSGDFYLFDPSSTTFAKHFLITTQMLEGQDMSFNSYISGYGNTTSAVDAVQFKMSSGNIDSGTIKLYGIKDS